MKAPSTPKRKTPAGFREGAEVFKSLSNASRLLIVDALSKGEHCVADLTELVGLDIATVSNHLAVLRGVGIVADKRRGTQVIYTLKSPFQHRVVTVGDRAWEECVKAPNFRACYDLSMAKLALQEAIAGH